MIKVSYDSSASKSAALTEIYHCTQDSSHRYLAYREIPAIFSRYVSGLCALDFGVGTGLSSRFLLDLGFGVSGADVSGSMLDQARTQFPGMALFQIENGRVPVASSSFDLVFSSFVLFELETINSLIAYITEAKRLLKQDGVIVAVTGSNHMHSPERDWFTFGTCYPDNNPLHPGQKVKALHYESGIEFTDYYWSEDVYSQVFADAGVRCIEVLHPLGKADEPYPWRDEMILSPFAIFVLGHA